MPGLPFQFELTDEQFKNCKALLAARGIELQPETKREEVRLQDNSIIGTCIKGNVRFDACECNYELEQEEGRARLFIYETYGQPLSGDKLMKLLDHLDQAFPQLEHGKVPRLRKKIVGTLFTAGPMVGCLLFFVVLLGAVCFFTFIGVRSYFKW